MIKLSTIKVNPANPRLIKDHNFKKLCDNIKSLPQMLALRPIIVNNEGIIQGGNMRFKALQELGYKEVPDEWVKPASSFTDSELRQFSILDNVGFGEWDWEMLANDWQEEGLLSWGMEEWNFGKVQFSEEPESVNSNIDKLKQIKEMRKKGNDDIINKTDTEKYLVIVFTDRNEKEQLLKRIGLPTDERYIPAGAVQLSLSARWQHVYKSARKNKSGATG